jgi:hypothetical protein
MVHWKSLFLSALLLSFSSIAFAQDNLESKGSALEGQSSVRPLLPRLDPAMREQVGSFDGTI